jgi:hypothetical protein
MSRKIETNVVKPEVGFKKEEHEYLLINNENEQKLDSDIEEIYNFIKNNTGKGKTNAEKDSLYLESQRLWKIYITDLESAKYNFYLNKEQWKFLTDLVLHKLDYDVNSVFFAIELKELFDSMKSTKYSSNEYIPYSVNATEVTYIYHLISKHTVKGLTKDSYLFSEVLLLIGAISKIFNYYDATGKNLSADIQDWVATFEEGVDFEKIETLEA